MAQNRDLGVELARAVGIFLVVFGHAGFPWPLEKAIYSMHMPFFFLLSGFVSKELSVGKTLLVKSKTLLIPYLVVFSFLWLFWGPGLLDGIDAWWLFCHDLLSAGRPDSIKFNSPLWFLPCLWSIFVIEALFRAMFSERRLLAWTFLAFLSVVFTIFIQPANASWSFRIATAISCSPFFVLGKLVRNMSNPLNVQLKPEKNYFVDSSGCIWKLYIAILFALIWILVTIVDRNYYYVISHDKYGFVLFFYIRGASGSLALFIFLRFLIFVFNDGYYLLKKIVIFVAHHSMFIYLFHKPLVIYFNYVVNSQLFFYLPKYIFLSSLGLIVPALFSFSMNLLIPRVHSIITGGRTIITDSSIGRNYVRREL